MHTFEHRDHGVAVTGGNVRGAPADKASFIYRIMTPQGRDVRSSDGVEFPSEAAAADAARKWIDARHA